MNCPFCDLIAGGVATCHGSVAVIPDAFPVTEGHTMITPVRHVADIFELTGREVADVHRLLRDLREQLRRGDSAIEGFNIGVNCGTSAGQTVPHAHVHLIPRRPGDTPHPEGGVRGVIPGRMRWEAVADAAAE
ncbi:HIT family protein [Herbidospora mongoliensis]|uniref:HIT family protein n=1 Tax=Herbidospora mongoliensis TaxID=688067 RepID=UPI00082D01C9|nr:HIT family protein [Herbidospora mongoliensis]